MADPHIFISYARAEPVWAERLEHDLLAHGYPVWRDTRGIPDGHDFTSVIEEAINASSHLLVCLTPSIAKASFVRREVNYALLLADPRFGGGAGSAPIVIPVLFPQGRPLVHIASLPFVTIASEGDYARGLDEIVQHIGRSTRSTQTGPQPKDARTEYLRALYDWCSKTLARTVAVPIEILAREAAGAVEARNAAFVPRFAISGAFATAARAQPTPALRETSLANEFEKSGSVLLVGGPAAGKTTALLALTRSLTAAALESTDAAIPCLASIPTWDGRTSVLDWLDEQTPPDVRGIPKILLLDGLDELGASRREDAKREDSPKFDPRARFLDWLDRDLPNARVVITTRKTDYEEMPRRARLQVAIELLPLGEHQIRAFVEGCQKPWLASVIAGDPELREIVRSPLLLAMLSEAIETTSDFDHGWSRRKVIDAWFTRVLQHEVSRSASDGSLAVAVATRELRLHAARLILEPLAGLVWRLELPRKPLPAVLDLAERVKLLRRSREGALEFAHLLLLDHFAMPSLAEFCVGLGENDSWRLAYAIVDSVGARAADFVVDYARKATNESVKMLATATRNLDDPAYVPALLAFDNHNTTATDMIAQASFARLGTRALEPLRARLIGADEHLRSHAAIRLAGIGQQGVDVLVANTVDVRPTVRRAALTGLVGTGAAGAACARAHIADPVADVRASALMVIAAGAPGSLGDLVLPLIDDEDANVRHFAIAAIGTACSPTIEAALTIRLDSERNEGVRADIVGALAECGATQVVLRTLQASDVSERIAGAIRGHATHLTTDALAALIREHPNRRVREELCYALFGRADAAPLFADVLRNDADTYVRVAAARALTTIGGDVAVFALGDALLASPPVQTWAATGLAEIGSDDAVRALWRGVESGRAHEGEPPQPNRLGHEIERALDAIHSDLSRKMLRQLPWIEQ